MAVFNTHTHKVLRPVPMVLAREMKMPNDTCFLAPPLVRKLLNKKTERGEKEKKFASNIKKQTTCY